MLPFSRYHRAYRSGLNLAAACAFEEAAHRLQQAVQLKPHEPRTRLQYGLALSEAGRYEEACEAVESAMALRPDVAVFPLFLGVVHFDAGKLDLARDMFERSLRLDSHNALAGNYAALVAWEEGSRQIAARALLDLDFIQSSRFEARLLVCVEQGFDESQAKGSALTESSLLGDGIFFASPDPSPWVRVYRKWRFNRCRRRANELSSRGNHEKAAFRLEEALELEPQNQEVRDAIAEVRKQWIQALQKRRKLEGKESGLSLEIGCLYWQNRDPDRAESLVAEWLEKHKAQEEKHRDLFRMSTAYRVLCGIAIVARNKEKSGHFLSALQALDPHDPFVQYMAGRYALLGRDTRSARHAFERFLAWEPAFGRVRLREWIHANPDTDPDVDANDPGGSEDDERSQTIEIV
ncbi:MAG: tetratricopeptide repeat protein [Planctomycetota bacterium]